jgi:hypothetical protein
LPPERGTGFHHVGGAKLQALAHGDALPLAARVVLRIHADPGFGKLLALEAHPLKERAHRPPFLVHRRLHRGKLRPFFGKSDAPGRKVGGDVALRQTPHSDGSFSHLGPPQPVAQQIAGKHHAQRKDHHCRQQENTVVP